MLIYGIHPVAINTRALEQLKSKFVKLKFNVHSMKKKCYFILPDSYRSVIRLSIIDKLTKSNKVGQYMSQPCVNYEPLQQNRDFSTNCIIMDLTCAGLLFGTVFKSVALYSLSNSRKKKVKVGVVSGIKIYPVKSLGGIQLDSVTCTKSGPKHGQITDR